MSRHGRESVSALMLISVLPRSEHDDDDDDVRVSSTAATVCRVIHYCSVAAFLSTSSSRQTFPLPDCVDNAERK